MKYFISYTLLSFLLLTSCGLQRKTKMYLANDDICFCGLDSSYTDHIDINDYDIEKIKETIEDTLINDNKILSTVDVDSWTMDKDLLRFMHINYKSNIMTLSRYYTNNGNLQSKKYRFHNLNVGQTFWVNENDTTYRSYNYIEPTTIDKVDSIAAKYPICWQEAIKLVRAKIGAFKVAEILRNNKRDFEDEPEHYWSIKVKRFGIKKNRCYLVNAETGEIQSKLIYGIKIP